MEAEEMKKIGTDYLNRPWWKLGSPTNHLVATTLALTAEICTRLDKLIEQGERRDGS